MSIIEVKDLVKSYNGTQAVSGVSFSVQAGETFGFLGPNGAGKTTTINILCTLLAPTSGTATVNGFDCSRQANDVRSSIGLVFQEMTLDNELTAYENLKFHCYLYGMQRALTEKRIDEMLEVVGLVDRKNALVKTFSGGMKRRLEIARGLTHRPKVLFLDEPTLGLDPQTRKHVWQFIEDLKKKEGNTVFMTTHYMEEAEACDRIVVIDKGRIIACDTPGNLKSSLSGDTIYLKTSDDSSARKELSEKLSLEARVIDGGGLSLIVENGERAVPAILGALATEVLSVSLKKPTLDDVFLHLTGSELRDSENSTQSVMPMRMQKRR